MLLRDHIRSMQNPYLSKLRVASFSARSLDDSSDLDTYPQAVTTEKRNAQEAVVALLFTEKASRTDVLGCDFTFRYRSG